MASGYDNLDGTADIVITTPLTIANCVLWMDASDGSKINSGTPADGDPVTTWADKSGNAYSAVQSAGLAQVETATVAETAEGTLTAGNATVIVTAAGMTNSPKTVSVALATNDTSAQAAGKIRTALAADVNVGAFFTVTGTTIYVVLTAVTVAANDATMNIDIADGTCVGLTAAHTSANTRQAATAAQARPVYKTNILNSLSVIRFDPTTRPQALVFSGAALNLFKASSGFSIAAVFTSHTNPAVFQAVDSSNNLIVQLNATNGGLLASNVAGVGATNISGENAFTTFGATSGTPGALIAAMKFLTGEVAIDGGLPYEGTFLDALGAMPNVAAGTLTVGAYPGASYQGDLAELIVYSRPLKGMERRLVLEYLSNKWGTL